MSNKSYKKIKSIHSFGFTIPGLKIRNWLSVKYKIPKIRYIRQFIEIERQEYLLQYILCLNFKIETSKFIYHPKSLENPNFQSHPDNLVATTKNRFKKKFNCNISSILIFRINNSSLRGPLVALHFNA